ncbi:MAG: hypothetical protein WD845_06675, partial [Pirellulales bacterium]
AGSPFADTDPNLHHATERIPTGLGGADSAAWGASQSHVLHSALARLTPEGAARGASDPPPPPIAVPPAPAPPVIVRPIQSAPRSVVGVVAPAPRAASLPPLVRPSAPPLSQVARPSHAGHWLSVAIMSGLIMVAVVLAILALAR